MKYTFEKIDFSSFQETSINDFKDKSIYTTKDWCDFLIEDSHIVPVIIKIFKDEKEIGYFYGGEIKKFGLKIIASPFSGWSTCWMGFELAEGENRYDIIEPLWNYLSKELHYVYCEIIDRNFAPEEIKSRGFTSEALPTLELQINRTDEELFKVFKTDCRNFIRQFERRGASIEIADPDDTFAEEYYDQLIDVFAKQDLKPSYSLEKVKLLLRTLSKTGKVLCLRVRAPEGNSIASSIFLGFNKKCFFWGGASYREHQHYRPNEYMIWTAIKYWRDRGYEVMDMVGDRAYKRKFGPVPVSYGLIYLTKYPILISGRNMAKKAYWALLKLKKILGR